MKEKENEKNQATMYQIDKILAMERRKKCPKTLLE
jgi:hypothetical protein